MSSDAMRADPATPASEPSALLRRVFACALAITLMLGLVLMSSSNHGAPVSSVGISSAIASDIMPDLGEGGETGSHCHCQTTVPGKIQIANIRAFGHEAFDLAHDPDLASVAADLQPEPPRA
jgi:hypothetical protein